MNVFINENIEVPGTDWVPNSREEFEENLLEVLRSLECFSFFGESQLYYNRTGIEILFSKLEFINEIESDYLLNNEIAQLRQAIIDSEAVDWSEKQLHRNDCYYLVQLGDGFCPTSANGSSLAEACEYKFRENKTVVLNFPSSQFNTDNVIKVNRVEINPPKTMKIVSIDSVCTKEHTIRYYLNNRIKIEYKHNDKHGENHNKIIPKNGKPVSPLECSIQEASDLLQVSISHKQMKQLYFYDCGQGREKFIEFQPESATTYHGYHPHNQEEIPEEIKLFLLERGNYKEFMRIYKEEFNGDKI